MENPLEIKRIDTKKHKIWQRSLMKMDIIPGHPCISIFCGSAGSGKSNLGANMLQNPHMFGMSLEGVMPQKNPITGMEKPMKEEPYFDIVFLLIGSADDMWDHCVDIGLIKKENVFECPTEDDIQKIINTQNALIEHHKGDITKAPKLLIIMDDLANDAKLLRSKALKTFFIKARHLNASTWFMTQYLNLVPKACRLQASYFFMFKFAKSEGELLYEQYCPPDIDKKPFIEMCDSVTKDDRDENGKIIKTNNFLLICKRAPEGKKFRKNFDKYIMPKDYDGKYDDEVDYKAIVKENNDLRKKLHEEQLEQHYVKEKPIIKKYEYVHRAHQGTPIIFAKANPKPAGLQTPINLKKRMPRKKRIVTV